MGNDLAAASSAGFRVGLVLTSDRVSRPVRDFIAWAREDPEVRLASVIVRDMPQGRPSGAAAAVALEWIHAFEGKSLSQITGDDSAYFAALGDPGVPLVDLAGAGNGLAANAIGPLRALELDILVTCDATELAVPLREAARLGVLDVSFGQTDSRAPMPPGLAQILVAEAGTEFAIRHFPPAGAEVRGLLSGSYSTKGFYLGNRASLETRVLARCTEILRKLARETPISGGAGPAEPHRRAALGLGHIAAYTGYRLRRKLGALVTGGLLGREAVWNVGYDFVDWTGFDHARARIIPNPPGRYLADPFTVTRDGQTCCFVEDYDIARARGHISAYRLSADRAEPLGPVLSEPFHMSFPYLFEHDSRLFMVPETHEARQIRLYECVAFPLQWRFVKTLMSEVSAVDSLIFPRSGAWWMLTNIDAGQKLGDHCSELFAFCAETPLSADWKPHPANPLVIDPTRARNGGLLRENGEIYRVAQKQGFEIYGAGLTINRLERLDAAGFVERTVRTVTAARMPGAFAAHHMHAADGVTVFDFCSRVRSDAGKSTPELPPTGGGS